MKNKTSQQRGTYHLKSTVFDNVKVKRLPEPTFKKLDKPILITFD